MELSNEIKQKSSKYNKEAIYRWREKNKDKYLSAVSNYNYNKYNSMSPEEKQILIDKIKLQSKNKKQKETKDTLNVIRRGRPRKHPINIECF